MVRILAAGDLHGDSLAAKRLASRAVSENVDLVILCGDIVSFDHDSKNLIKPFKDVGKKLLLIPGNHDGFATADFLASFYDVKNIHGYTLQYDNVSIIGCGGANVGIERLTENEIFDVLQKGFSKVDDASKKVMVTHVFPSGSLMDKLSHVNVPGSTGVLKAINTLKPDILFCSHAHEAAGIEEKIGSTTVICVGKEGKIVDV